MLPSESRLCAVSVDLDEIPNYFAIHGLKPPGGSEAHAVYRTALARFDDLAVAEGIPLTFFAVASDLRLRENALALRRLVGRGHEVSNHSFDHLYDITRLDRGAMWYQVVDSARLIEASVGVKPVGFRAPGYVITDALMEVLSEAGVLYDSSVFPCPLYYGAKAVALGLISARLRSSHSILGSPRVLLAPTLPYRVGGSYFRRGGGFVEFPIQVTRGLRFPYIGTSLVLAGRHGAGVLTRMVVGEPFINLELHGIDLLDESDGLGGLVGTQPDVTVSVERKLAVFSGVVRRLRGAGYSFVRLDEAARCYSGR